jgi:predicted nucleic acid-binding protein
MFVDTNFIIELLREQNAKRKGPARSKLESIRTEGFAANYGEIAALLRTRGTPVPLMDLLIATLVKCHGSPILTRDREHFERVPGVVVENY